MCRLCSLPLWYCSHLKRNLSFVETGDHILMVDTCYEPTRDFCDTIMKKMGVETTYYGANDWRRHPRPYQAKYQGTVYRISGSVTMEVQDVPTLARIAHEHDIIVMLDTLGRLV
ncbi:PLP-dependent transferase [Vibrio lentus]|nr:PLP-dependent transferase [Vibrio lentus]